MSVNLERYNQHFARLAPEVEADLPTICTDERGMQDVAFGVQHAGGSYGVAHVLHTAEVLAGRAPASTNLAVDGRSASALINGSTHMECAALINAASVDDIMIERPDEVLYQANGLLPGVLAERDADRAREAALFRKKTHMHMLADETLRIMADPERAGQPVPHLHLHHDVPHAGDVMIGNDVQGEYYDSPGAFEVGNGAYGFTVHRMGNMAMRLDALYPGVSQNDAFVKASAWYHGAVSLAVPNSTGAPGVQTLYRGSHFANAA